MDKMDDVMKVKYRTITKYKYAVLDEVEYQTGINIDVHRVSVYNSGREYAAIERNGKLTIYPDYMWDGPSGPTIDTDNWMDASLVHDALYQMMRRNLIPFMFRKKADRLMRRMCIEAGMSRFRANYSYFFVRVFGAHRARGKKNRR